MLVTLRSVAVVATLLAVPLSYAAPQQAAPNAGTASTGALIAGGALGSLAGLVAGVMVGNGIDNARGFDRHNCSPNCTRWGAAAGAFGGATVGIALGVHLADHARGRFLPVVGWTAAGMAGAMGASFVGDRAMGEGGDMLGMLVGLGATVGLAIHGERATAPAPRPAPAEPRTTSLR